MKNDNQNLFIIPGDPQNWDDVLQAERVKLYCHNCESNQFAFFYFLCWGSKQGLCERDTHRESVVDVTYNYQNLECPLCLGTVLLFFLSKRIEYLFNN